MKLLPLQRESIQPRIDGIQYNFSFLKHVSTLTLNEFSKPEILDRVHHHLRLALEGIFNITSHILSRIPGGRETEYKRMAKKLGELGIIDQSFANTQLVNMAGYRNRLTHFYATISSEELYNIVTHHLSDIETFLKFIKKVLDHPSKFQLKVD